MSHLWKTWKTAAVLQYVREAGYEMSKGGLDALLLRAGWGLHQPFEQPHRRIHCEPKKSITAAYLAQVSVWERYDKRKILLTKHARGPVPDLEKHEEDERYEKGDEGSGVDGDDVLAVLS
jgi:hypothetical protein